MKRVFALILLIFASCSHLPTKMPKDSILANSGCDLPCWYGINVGSTTKQQLLDILSKTSIVNQDSITITKADNKLFDENVFFTMGKGPKELRLDNGEAVKQDYLWSGDISVLDDKVAQIVLAGDLGVTVQQLIDIFGEPTYVAPFYTSGLHIWVEIMNPSSGLDFGYRAENLDSKLAADTPIDSLMLFDPKLYGEMIQNKMFLYLLLGPNNIDEYPWKGYRDLRTYWPAE